MVNAPTSLLPSHNARPTSKDSLVLLPHSTESEKGRLSLVGDSALVVLVPGEKSSRPHIGSRLLTDFVGVSYVPQMNIRCAQHLPVSLTR